MCSDRHKGKCTLLVLLGALAVGLLSLVVLLQQTVEFDPATPQHKPTPASRPATTSRDLPRPHAISRDLAGRLRPGRARLPGALCWRHHASVHEHALRAARHPGAISISLISLRSRSDLVLISPQPLAPIFQASVLVVVAAVTSLLVVRLRHGLAISLRSRRRVRRQLSIYSLGFGLVDALILGLHASPYLRGGAAG